MICGCGDTQDIQKIVRKKQLKYFQFVQNPKIKDVIYFTLKKEKQGRQNEINNLMTAINLQSQIQRKPRLQYVLATKFFNLQSLIKQNPQQRYLLVLEMIGKFRDLLNFNQNCQMIEISSQSSSETTLKNFIDILIDALICLDAELERQNLDQKRIAYYFNKDLAQQLMQMKMIDMNKKIEKQLTNLIF